MQFSSLKEGRSAYSEKSGLLARVWQEAGQEFDFTKVKCLGDGLDTEAKATRVRELNTELSEIQDALQPLEQAAAAAQRAAEEAEKARERDRQPVRPMVHATGTGEPGKSGDPVTRKGLGRAVAEQIHAKGLHKGGVGNFAIDGDVELKFTFMRPDGWEPEVVRTGLVVEIPIDEQTIISLIPTAPLGAAGFRYMEEVLQENNADWIPEAGPYPKSAYKLEERRLDAEKIGHYVEVTDEQLEDVAQAGAYLDGRLRIGIQDHLDWSLLHANGAPPKIRGLLQWPGLQTQAKGADPTPDAIHKAITKVDVVGHATASAVLMHPNDWQNIRLLRTTDGIYIWGPPMDPGPARIWGLPVRTSRKMTQGTALTGAFNTQSQFWQRRGIDVQTAFVNDQFIHGLRSIRADMRGLLAVYRPVAFSTITGL